MEPQSNSEPLKKEIKLDFKEAKYATGRRKTSVARVWWKKGSGSIYVNGKKIIDYCKKTNLQAAVYRPFKVVKMENEYDVGCFVKGGGSSRKVEAIMHGIERALEEIE